MRQSWKSGFIAPVLTASLLLQGCAGPNAQLQYLLSDSAMSDHYNDAATAIEYPIDTDESPVSAELLEAPRGIKSLDEVTHRPITLYECVRMALDQATVLRDDGSFSSPGNTLLARPSSAPSIYDSAIQETSFLFGNRGTEAALSDFDALFTTGMTWGRSEDPQNSSFLSLTPGQALVQETGNFSMRVEKPLANSGTVAFQHDWDYEGSNIPSGGATRLFKSAYTGFARAEYRQPLLAGSGTDFTRISGPLGQQLRGVSGVSQGVAISRINSDISLTEFEQSATGLVRDVTNRYWDLFHALQLYDSEIQAFDDLRKFWARLELRQFNIDSGQKLQAESRLYEAEARIKGSLADVLEAEVRLRRLMSLPLNDGTFLSPSDLPTEAELQPNWEESIREALSRRVELRRQKWQIRSLELQLSAARNLSRPRLDLVSQYQVNGFGDNLTGESDDDGLTAVGYDSAYETLAQGLHTTWNLGLQFSLPVGLRLARTQVRNYEIRLRKARALLAEQEKEISYELAGAMLNMERWYELANSQTKRIDATRSFVFNTQRRIEDDEFLDAFRIGRALDATIQLRDAEQGYMRAIIEYTKGINEFAFRRGTLLKDYGVSLAEGEWNPGAYKSAKERGDKMSSGLDNMMLRTEPMEFVAGPAEPGWEAQGHPNRPHIPGGMAAAPESSTESAPPPVPDEVPPMGDPGSPTNPMPQPPPQDGSAEDLITGTGAAGHGAAETSPAPGAGIRQVNGQKLPPQGLNPALFVRPTDTTGRVRLSGPLGDNP